MSDPKEQSKIIHKIVQLAENTPEVEVLWLYGSRAKGNANNNSDYDLAIAFKTYIDDPLERRLKPELLVLKWKNQLKIELSVIDINQVPLPLAYTVIQDNTTLYSNNEYRRMVEEQKIMSKWEIDYLHHQKYYA
jgi:predicted nucleotidyltransferase